MPVLETHSEHRGHWCGSWNHHEISHLGNEFKQNWKVTSCLTVQFSFPGLPTLVRAAKFCINSSVLQSVNRADTALQDLSRELCTLWISSTWEQPAEGQVGFHLFPSGHPCLLSFQWQVVCVRFQELLTHFMKCGSRKEKLLTKTAFITTLLSHAFLFFLTNYEEQNGLSDL